MKKFEVVNAKGVVTMSTEKPYLIPDESVLESMLDAGYKFRIDGKSASKKKVSEVKYGKD